jgi:hypothetical protein
MDNPFARKKRRLHVPRRRSKSGWSGSDMDCCCIVGEVFDGPCFVATAAHDGNRAAEPVRTLRRYRDQRLARNAAGRAFTRLYYRYGRCGARFLRRFPVFKPVVRTALRPLVAYARTRIR